MTKEKDSLKKWFICEDRAIITLAKTTNLVNKAMRLHNLTPTTTAVLGRSLTMLAMMSTRLKDKTANITSILYGGGPAGKVVTVAKANGSVKGYVEHPQIDLYLNKFGKLDVSGAVGKNGKLRVVTDLGFGKPYSGEVDIVSGEIAEDYVQYYYTSLQQPSAIALGVLVSPQNNCISSAGMLIEMLPDANEEDIKQVEQVVSKIKDFSRLMEKITIEEFIDEYFPNNKFLEYDVEPKFECKCSKVKVLKILKGMNKTDVENLFEKDDHIEAHCDFCNKTITINRTDLNL